MLRLFLITFFKFQILALPLQQILHAKTPTQLKQLIKKNENKKMLEKMCEQQKNMKKIPTACYKLGELADLWCLNLHLQDLRQLKNVEKALKSKYLSKKCRDYLNKTKKILQYKQRDFFLPELKKYFTSKKPFF